MSNLNKIIVRKLERLVNPHTTIQVGDYNIECSKNHPLKYYLDDMPLYDRFLGHLAAQLQPGTCFIDIGANIGDTVAGIVSRNESMFYICVEPDPQFYKILLHNISAIKQSSKSQVHIETVQAFISSSDGEELSVQKSTTGSTGHAVTADRDHENTTIKSMSYESLLLQGSYPPPDIVKIDTDGFDHQILKSMSTYFKSTSDARPVIFFELMPYLDSRGFKDPDRMQRGKQYLDAIASLLNQGYDEFVVFDNFGTPIMRSNNLSILRQLIEYTYISQVINKKTTFYLMDVLLLPRNKRDAVNNALEQHLKSFKAAVVDTNKFIN